MTPRTQHGVVGVTGSIEMVDEAGQTYEVKFSMTESTILRLSGQSWQQGQAVDPTEAIQNVLEPWWEQRP